MRAMRHGHSSQGGNAFADSNTSRIGPGPGPRRNEAGFFASGSPATPWDRRPKGSARKVCRPAEGRHGARIKHGAWSAPSRSVDVARSVQPVLPSRLLPVLARRRARGVELGNRGRQVHGREDLPGNRLALDQGDQAQRSLAFGA